MNERNPQVGDQANVHARGIGRARIIAIHPANTIDVQAEDGRCYRVSGLDLTDEIDAPMRPSATDTNAHSVGPRR